MSDCPLPDYELQIDYVNEDPGQPWSDMLYI